MASDQGRDTHLRADHEVAELVLVAEMGTGNPRIFVGLETQRGDTDNLEGRISTGEDGVVARPHPSPMQPEIPPAPVHDNRSGGAGAFTGTSAAEAELQKARKCRLRMQEP